MNQGRKIWWAVMLVVGILFGCFLAIWNKPNEGCGVKLNGVTYKELLPRVGSTCRRDREIIERKFLQKCHGRSGTDEGDRACGAKLTLDIEI